MEIATPGRMRLATKLSGKPHTGARPTISSRSGKPLKNSPKKPSTSPAVNHSGRPIGEADLAQPLAISNRHAVRAQVQLRLQVQGQQFRPLRFDHDFILCSDLVLKADEGLFGNVV